MLRIFKNYRNEWEMVIMVAALLAVIAVVSVNLGTKAPTPKDENQRAAAMMEQLKTAEFGDFLITKSEKRPVLFVNYKVGKAGLRVTFRMGDRSAEGLIDAMSTDVIRVVKKGDEDYPATAVKFLEQ